MLITAVAYRKDIFEREQARKKSADQARIAGMAAGRDANQDEPPLPARSDDDESYHDHAPPPASPSGNPVAPHSPRPAPAARAAPEVKKLRLTLRGSHGEVKLAAKLTHTISKLLSHYGQKHGLSADAIAKLSLEDPDGEVMDRQATVGGFEIEDEDLLTVLDG